MDSFRFNKPEILLFFGFDMNFNELSTYLTPLLEKINELTPLKKNGNNQRSN
jgi:hypothetical protein